MNIAVHICSNQANADAVKQAEQELNPAATVTIAFFPDIAVFDRRHGGAAQPINMNDPTVVVKVGD